MGSCGCLSRRRGRRAVAPLSCLTQTSGAKARLVSCHAGLAALCGGGSYPQVCFSSFPSGGDQPGAAIHRALGGRRAFGF